MYCFKIIRIIIPSIVGKLCKIMWDSAWKYLELFKCNYIKDEVLLFLVHVKAEKTWEKYLSLPWNQNWL